jgi:hypothetical protein
MRTNVSSDHERVGKKVAHPGSCWFSTVQEGRFALVDYPCQLSIREMMLLMCEGGVRGRKKDPPRLIKKHFEAKWRVGESSITKILELSVHV